VTIYLRDRVPEQKRPEKAAQRLEQVLGFWGEKVLADINGRSCRDYVAWRQTHAWKSATKAKSPRMVTAAGARRELEDLAAAVSSPQAEGLPRGTVKVTLPPRSPSRTRYLRRSEVAAMLWLAWRKREAMVVTRGPRRGQPVTSERRPWRHIARFLLIGA